MCVCVEIAFEKDRVCVLRKLKANSGQIHIHLYVNGVRTAYNTNTFTYSVECSFRTIFCHLQLDFCRPIRNAFAKKTSRFWEKGKIASEFVILPHNGHFANDDDAAAYPTIHNRIKTEYLIQQEKKMPLASLSSKERQNYLSWEHSFHAMKTEKKNSPMLEMVLKSKLHLVRWLCVGWT